MEDGPEEQPEFSYRQRLKAAVHYTAGCLCEEVASDKEVQFSRQTIAAISELTFRQCENFARDLEMFASTKQWVTRSRPSADMREEAQSTLKM
ncbi:centromere protein S [Erinaceus europaeus]|uniref:Centromere protein S n=1 Tax=Erinaceus europaeus TaxID=9365 RepID=A0ABM3VRG5_ERIEU|nr:centromere protein S [Erinaceus europaeus]